MAATSVNIEWKQNMAFDANINGHIVPLDADERVGGENYGARPKPFILVALGGCTGMDVKSILGKMRVDFDSFNVDVSGEMTEEHPKYFDRIHIKYSFKGKNLPMDKLEKAVNLSQERYCGVSAMLKDVAEITHEIIIED